jgi:hypothetical protein
MEWFIHHAVYHFPVPYNGSKPFDNCNCPPEMFTHEAESDEDIAAGSVMSLEEFGRKLGL